jgi:two-component system sensor histidine kinase UhpB
MRVDFWRGWSMRTRLLAITLIPLAYMFCTFVLYAWQSRMSEVGDELAERGPLVARVLADGSEFAVVARRTEELRPTINGLLNTDASIRRIDVLDAQRRELLHAAAKDAAQDQAGDQGADQQRRRYYEAPILKRLMWVNMLAADGTPYFKQQGGQGGAGAQRSGVTVETVGYVRVTMSPSALSLKQARRFYVELLVASLGLLACAMLAFRLSKGLNESLQASMQALREADAEKRRLIRQVNTAVEEERKSIALEIHDELNATLIAARLEAQRIVDLTADESKHGVSRAEIRTRAQSIITLALGLYNSGRSLVRRLRPEVLDMLGLDGAVEEVVRHYDGAHAGCRFNYRADGDFSTLDSAAGISAYRMIQEALSNIVKHARATRASVTLALDAAGLRIVIADNGAGFDAASTGDGIGIVGMRERVYAFNGSIAIATAIGDGTRIAIFLPAGAH